jgi:hypothetical protein
MQLFEETSKRQQGNEQKGMDMLSNNKKLIAVIGATGQQGGGVVRALQASGEFKVRALTRNPDKDRQLADEVVKADLDHQETLEAAFKGAYGVFLVTNFREKGTDELKQATAAVRAAKDAGVKHFVWSTLPNVEAISGGKFDVPHFTRIIRSSSRLATTRILWALSLRKSRQTDPWAGLFRLIPMCVAFTWATFANLATSLLEHSHTQMRQAMASICHSSVIF